METGESRIALVTGANKGLGLAIARQLGGAGLVVLAAARDAAKGSTTVAKLAREGFAVRFVPLDVAVEASVRAAAAAEIDAAFGRSGILVNNAGIGDGNDGPPSGAAVETARRLLGTNFLGTLRVTKVMLPLSRRSPNARIVDMSGSLGSLVENDDPASPYHGARLIGYNASKAALSMLTVQLAHELRGDGILVNSACPCYVATDLDGRRGPLSVHEGAAVPVRLALDDERIATERFVAASGEVRW
jgi:NAD(P)-dependent dehydrogenase (short-subunit alcohol dehydrogenase family)